MQTRSWRRGWHAAWLTVAALSVALVVSIAAPTTASADIGGTAATRCLGCYQTLAAPLSYTGWTRLNLNYCAPGTMCAAIYRVSTTAWRWNGITGWSQTSLPGNQLVYVAPYSAPFRWAWTESTGWVAVSGGRFEYQSAMRSTQPIAY